jgi:hypothetical protein
MPTISRINLMHLDHFLLEIESKSNENMSSDKVTLSSHESLSPEIR